MLSSVGRVFAALALGCSVQGVRNTRRSDEGVRTKMVAGVPILNYDMVPRTRGANGEVDWTVVVGDAVTDAQIKAMCEKSTCMKVGHPDVGAVPFFEIKSTEAELERVIVQARGAIKFVEPDMEAHVPELDMPSLVEASTEASASWGLDRIGVSSSDKLKGKGVNVYVLDTGIHGTHEDFGGRVGEGIDYSSSPSGTGDLQGHGTHCAGTVAGATFGVAPEATLFSMKVLSDSGSGQFGWSTSALDDIIQMGKRPFVASMSLGGQGIVNSMKVAIDAAVKGGLTVVVAGGNSNSDACGFSPAFVPTAITVGSTTNKDARSSFSNYGGCTDIWAPGSAIVSAKTQTTRASVALSGTSMACPHVSGAAALLLAVNREWTPKRVITELLETAEKGAISGLKDKDVNELLWVSTEPAPTRAPAPTKAPKDCSRCTGWFSCKLKRCRGCC